MRCLAERLPDMSLDAERVRSEFFSRSEDRHCNRSPELVVRIEIALAAVQLVAKTNVQIGENATGKACGVHTQPHKDDACPERLKRRFRCVLIVLRSENFANLPGEGGFKRWSAGRPTTQAFGAITISEQTCAARF